MTIPKHIMDEARAVWATLPKEAAGIHAIAEALHRIDLAAEQRGREEEREDQRRLFEKARSALIWWQEEHGCCAGESDELIAELSAVLRSRTEGNAE